MEALALIAFFGFLIVVMLLALLLIALEGYAAPTPDEQHPLEDLTPIRLRPVAADDGQTGLPT